MRKMEEATYLYIELSIFERMIGLHCMQLMEISAHSMNTTDTQHMKIIGILIGEFSIALNGRDYRNHNL